MEKFKKDIEFSYGYSKKKADTIVLSVTGTGLNLDDPEHHRMMRSLMKIMGSVMFSIGNNVPIDNIVSVFKEEVAND